MQANNWFLVYAANDDPAAPVQGHLDLSRAHDIVLDVVEPRQFRITFSDGSAYALKASTEDEATEWVRELIARVFWEREHRAEIVKQAAKEDLSFGKMAAHSQQQREQQERVEARLAEHVRHVRPKAESRGSVFVRSSGGMLPERPRGGASDMDEVDEEDSEEDEEKDYDESDSEASDSGDGGPMSEADAYLATERELGREPQLYAPMEKEKSASQWQRRVVRIMSGFLAYYVKEEKASISASYRLGQPRGVIPLEMVDTVVITSAERCFDVVCLPRPDDEEYAQSLDDLVVEASIDTPDSRGKKPKSQWGRTFRFKTRKAEDTEEAVRVACAALAWWRRCREYTQGKVPPRVPRKPHRASTKSHDSAPRVSRDSPTAAAAASAAPARSEREVDVSDGRPLWLAKADRALKELSRAKAKDADVSVLARLQADAFVSAETPARQAKEDAAAVLRAAAADDKEQSEGTKEATRLGVVVVALSEAFAAAIGECEAYRALGVAKMLIRAFDFTLSAELRPWEIGSTSSSSLKDQSFETLHKQIAGLEAYLKVRTRSVIKFGLTFTSAENKSCRTLRSQRRTLVEAVVDGVKREYQQYVMRVREDIRKWDDSVAAPQPSSGPARPEMTKAPKVLASMFNMHVNLASRSKCALLQQQLLSSTMEAVSMYVSGVLQDLQDQQDRDPQVLLEGIEVCRIINDCSQLVKHVEEKGREFSKALEEETSQLDSQVVQIAEEEHDRASHGEGEEEDDEEEEESLEAELEEERADLRGVIDDRPRTIQSVRSAGYQMLRVLRNLILYSLTGSIPHLTSHGDVADAAPPPAEHGAASAAPSEASDDEATPPQFPLLFTASWDAPVTSEEPGPVRRILATIQHWYQDLTQWLGRQWLRRLTALIFEQVVSEYCRRFLQALSRGKRLIGAWKVTEERRKKVEDDVHLILTFFGRLELAFALRKEEYDQAVEDAEAQGDEAAMEMTKAIAESETSLTALCNVLRDVTIGATATVDELVNAGKRAVSCQQLHSVEILTIFSDCLKARDDTRSVRTRVIAELEAFVEGAGTPSAHTLSEIFKAGADPTVYDATFAALKILDSIVPNGKELQAAFWKKHKPKAARRSVAPTEAAKPMMVSSAEVEAAPSFLDGEAIGMSDFMGGGVPPVVSLPTAGKDVRTPTSGASTRRKSRKYSRHGSSGLGISDLPPEGVEVSPPHHTDDSAPFHKRPATPPRYQEPPTHSRFQRKTVAHDVEPEPVAKPIPTYNPPPAPAASGKGKDGEECQTQ
jgi:hypothetical protein